MQAIKCELCGSNELIKKDGFFQCEYCGTKYTTEEAKKMMVDITGSTVKVDTSDRLKNLYHLARRARSEEDYESAIKYYDMILIDSPLSWEASFYTVFYTVYLNALHCEYDEINNLIVSSSSKISNCIKTVFMIIKDNVIDSCEQEDAFTEVSFKVMDLAKVYREFVEKQKYSISDIHTEDGSNRKKKQECDKALCAIKDLLYCLGDLLEEIFSDSKNALKLASQVWRMGVEIHKKNRYGREDNKIILDYEDKARRCDPEYVKEKAKERITEIDELINEIIEDKEVNSRKLCGYISMAFAIIGALVAFIFSLIFIGCICLCAVTVCLIVIIRAYKTERRQKERIKNLEKEKEELEKQINK